MRRDHATPTIGLALVLALLLLGPSLSHAISITFDPEAQDVFLGDQAMVDIVISDLGLGGPPSLSAFDLIVTYDTSILAFNSASFGDPVLGDQLDIFGFGLNSTLEGEFFPGEITLLELSLDSNADLDAFQADSFVLASLTFDTLSLGTSDLQIPTMLIPGIDFVISPIFASTELDDSGFPVPLNVDLNDGSITVIARDGTAPVPEPGTILLLGFGLFGLVGVSKKFG